MLSGNRNFEGRINPDVKMNYLASPPLCVAYALAGTMDIDIVHDPIGSDADGNDVYLRDIWPSEKEVAETVGEAVQADMFRRSYGEVFAGDDRWNGLEVPERRALRVGRGLDLRAAAALLPGHAGRARAGHSTSRARACWRCSATASRPTTSRRPGAIKRDSPAGSYLQEQGVEPRDFNSYGSRRGNHEVMMRGTFANIRLRNLIGGGEKLPEGGYTRYFGGGSAEQMTIYDAAMRYLAEGTDLVVLAGKEYGSGSSRDWAAKGTRLLGVRAVIAQSFERIHRSNLVGMGVLPLQFPDGQSAADLGLTGEETISISGLAEAMGDGGAPPREVKVRAEREGAEPITFSARVRIDTPREADYFRHGGILQFVLRGLLAA